MFKKQNQTVNKLNNLLEDCNRYKRKRWIENHYIITCIELILVESDNNKLTIEALINLEVQIENMSDKMGKSMPFKAFMILLNTAKRACKAGLPKAYEQ